MSKKTEARAEQSKSPENSTAAFVLPFAIFIVMLALRTSLHLNPKLEYALRCLFVSIAILVFWSKSNLWRPHISSRSIGIGVGVFVIWILPDLLWPGYRNHWIFQNAITGKIESSIPLDVYGDPFFLSLRVFGSIIVVPIAEELFWRGWLMRYIINPDFKRVALNTFKPLAFFLTAILFASEHGPFWDVGLAAGIAYNWWVIRSRSLGDCMIAHAVTNLCLAAYVIFFHQWQYWL